LHVSSLTNELNSSAQIKLFQINFIIRSDRLAVPGFDLYQTTSVMIDYLVWILVWITGVDRNFDWEGSKMKNLVTLVWWRFSVT